MASLMDLKRHAIRGLNFHLPYYLFRGFLGYFMGKECSSLTKDYDITSLFQIYIYIYTHT